MYHDLLLQHLRKINNRMIETALGEIWGLFLLEESGYN